MGGVRKELRNAGLTLLLQVAILPITTQGSFATGNKASALVPVTAGENEPENA